MVTPGGRVEEGETPEDTVLREVTEETTVRIANPKLVYVEEPNDGRWGTQYIYLCEYVSGESGKRRIRFPAGRRWLLRPDVAGFQRS